MIDLINKIRKITNNVKLDESLGKHTSFCIGGTADTFLEVANIKQLKEVLKYADSEGIPLFVIGRGTNLLIKDNGIRGIVLRLTGEFNKVEFNNEEVILGAAVDLPVLASKSFARGLSGLEFAVGIPGSVGGATVTNAGAYEESIGDVLENIVMMDIKGKIHTLNRDSLRFEYRCSHIPIEGIILTVRLKLQVKDKNDIIKKVQLCVEKRRKNQGISFPNIGCIFKNPGSYNAGKLIEEAGLKGFRIGGAQISVKHANYIVNLGGATAQDVLSLIEYIKEKVKDKFNILLELEIKVVGE